MTVCGCRRDLEFGVEFFESTRRQLGTAGHKLQESRHFFLREVTDDDPEPRDHLLEAGVDAHAHHRVFLEVLVTDSLCATHKQL